MGKNARFRGIIIVSSLCSVIMLACPTGPTTPDDQEDPREYALVFHGNGGSGSMEPQQIVFGQSANLKPNAFTYEGHQFAGWSLGAGGPVQYGDGALFTMNSEGAELWAAWTGNPGTLDLRFGDLGIRATDFSYYTVEPADMVVQPDGKILVAGYVYDGLTDTDIALMRFLPDGSVDEAFADDGLAIHDFELGHDKAYAVALQADGKILVAAEAVNTVNNDHGFPIYYSDMALLRYAADGSLDPTFGTGGVVTADVYGANDCAVDVIALADGKILLLGTAYDDIGSGDFALLRYDADGTLDDSFGTGGSTHFGVNESDEAYGMSVLPGGGIVVGGQSYIYDEVLEAWRGVISAARFTSSGAVDSAFGTGGQSLADFGSEARTRGMAVSPDGSIFIVGTLDEESWAIARFTASGELDESFGTAGLVTTDMGDSYDEAHCVTVQEDGTLLVAGYAEIDGFSRITLARYDLDGSLDAGFGTDGLVRPDVPTAVQGWGDALAIQDDGMILLAGHFYDDVASRTVLMRLWP